LTADCGPTSEPITVPASVTTVDGGGHTISGDDAGAPQFNGGILTNATPGQTMNVVNVTITGPAGGFQLCTQATNVLSGILFNDASGSVNNVVVDHIFQFQNNAFGSCQAGRAIRADGGGTARTVTITNTVVRDYQKSGFEARGSMTLNVSASTAGPPHPLVSLIAQNALELVNGPSGTITNNTLIGSGDEAPGLGGSDNGTAVLLFGASNVTVDHNTITGAGTDLGVSVTQSSSNITISFNQIGRTAPDQPDPTGHGVDVDPDSSATLICNTFSGWNTNIVGAIQMSCTPLPNGAECTPYSANVLSVDGGTAPFTWSTTGTLPPGLSLAASNGAITGTPTQTGTFNFPVTVTDSSEPNLTATQPQTITIAPGCAPPTTTTTSPTVSGAGVSATGATVTPMFTG
jgi:hypothetical protein